MQETIKLQAELDKLRALPQAKVEKADEHSSTTQSAARTGIKASGSSAKADAARRARLVHRAHEVGCPNRTPNSVSQDGRITSSELVPVYRAGGFISPA